MSAEIVENFDTWPLANRLELDVLADDGELARLYAPHSAEVTLIERLGSKQLIVPLGFHSLEDAKRAGKILGDAFTAVREIQDAPPPRLCSLHHWHVGLFSRATTHLAVCERCGAVADLVIRPAGDGS